MNEQELEEQGQEAQSVDRENQLLQEFSILQKDYELLKASHDKLVEDVRKTIHYINGTGEVNKWKISNWLEQALKECEQ